MAYDQRVADRIRHALGPRRDVTEKKMFGGIAFLVDGKMFVGLAGDDLMVRVGPDRYQAALAERHVRPMDFTGKPMVGYVFVSPEGIATARALRKWLDRALAFVATVEKKQPRRKRPPRFPRAGARPAT